MKCDNTLAENVCLYSDVAECDCGKPLNREGFVKDALVNDGVGEVFINKSASFIVCDDLRVVPVVSGFLQTLNNLGITHTDGAELTTLSNIGNDEIMDLLKFCLFSATPLTDLVMKKTTKSSTATKPELLQHIKNGDDAESRKMVLKVFLHKSTDKFLLAEATDEFVEFLFSFLTVPLGGVEYLLGGNTCFKNIDNLYKSVRDVFDDKFFRTPDMKQRLLNPKLPHGYISKNKFLPLCEESPPVLTNLSGVPLVFKSCIGDGSFMKDQTMYIVSDDLTVSPFSITSSFSILNGLGFSLLDVKEKDFEIGMEEALGIIKASLTSTTVFTDALINPMLKKPPKQPKIEP